MIQLRKCDPIFDLELDLLAFVNDANRYLIERAGLGHLSRILGVAFEESTVQALRGPQCAGEMLSFFEGISGSHVHDDLVFYVWNLL